jgi:hypothetical protein
VDACSCFVALFHHGAVLIVFSIWYVIERRPTKRVSFLWMP